MNCSKKQSEIPDGVLNRDEMVRVLIEVHILEAKIKKLYLNKDSSQVVYNHYEKMLFDDMGVSKETYDESVAFYVEHLEVYQGIYERVVDSLMVKQKANKD